MNQQRKMIYKDVQKLIAHHGTRDPRTILEERNVKLIPFKESTKLLGMYKVFKRNKFVFYNPFIDERILNMVLAHELGHDIYHQELAKKEDIIEYELFNITTSTELEANLFASHLLIDDDELMEYIREGRCYEELASIFNVNINLMFFKLNEMYRMGYPINRLDVTCNSKFFADIDGTDTSNHEIY
ncbi:MAG: ImmA/IrrE family metallo-endopeptidase [Tissierellia bacterium]|jgi:Zn-dependent peptidase ImmA (M78 family)|nr:ImmA/IrrE family metallo-endopeptidase [Tissierellia bacterium]HZJ69177.1 ImmA/IrrE family metallo-endopeptidase [Candidatus Eisenbacteria bacterium]